MSQGQASVVLKKGRAQPIWQGHPWVYAGAVEKTEGLAQPGSVVLVKDADQKILGQGFYNPQSQIRVRMLTSNSTPLCLARPNVQGDAAIHEMIAERLQQAAKLRARVGLPNEKTNAFRLVNSEGDRLPGLTVDVYADWAVVQFTTLGMKHREAAVYEGLQALPNPFRPNIIAEVPVGRFAQLEGFVSIARVVHGPLDTQQASKATVECKEAGVRIEVAPLQGQKTGMFLDQRENRVELGRYARNANVLDVYSYAGGFALQTLLQGAAQATCVDSSARALGQAERHAKLNELKNLQIVEMDAFRFLETATPYHYDVVVVDPPKFASAQKDVAMALKGYKRLNALALNAVKPGGLLASCSCSQLIDPASFERMLAAAAVEAGRQVTVLTSRSQGPDHPVPPAFSEGQYLKFVLLSVT